MYVYIIVYMYTHLSGGPTKEGLQVYAMNNPLSSMKLLDFENRFDSRTKYVQTTLRLSNKNGLVVAGL